MKDRHIVLNPELIDETLDQLAVSYDLDWDTLQFLRRIIQLYVRPVTLYVDESHALFYSQTPLVDKFTFNMKSDDLVLFSSDPMTFIDAMIEMAMYMAGFATLIGVDDFWKIEFAIGAWKPVKNRIKRVLGIPVIDEPLWVIGLPAESDASAGEDANPFQALVAHLDIASFTQMIRLAARDDVEVNFPQGAHPRVIEVYVQVKNAMNRVADGLLLEDWREFNRRLLVVVQELEEEYQPERLPVPHWWQQSAASANSDRLHQADASAAPDAVRPFDAAEGPPGERGPWNPFAAYLDELLGDED